MDATTFLVISLVAMIVLVLFILGVRKWGARRINEEISQDIRIHVSEYLKLKERSVSQQSEGEVDPNK
jgi:hypothetical protein